MADELEELKEPKEIAFEPRVTELDDATARRDGKGPYNRLSDARLDEIARLYYALRAGELEGCFMARDLIYMRQRHNELVALVRNTAMTAIEPDEADELRGQIGSLIAEVGTLRAENKKLNKQLDEEAQRRASRGTRGFR